MFRQETPRVKMRRAGSGALTVRVVELEEIAHAAVGLVFLEDEDEFPFVEGLEPFVSLDFPQLPAALVAGEVEAQYAHTVTVFGPGDGRRMCVALFRPC